MALVIITPKPRELLDAIKRAIDDKKIDTWSYDAEGDFTHTPEQFVKKAWLRPVVSSGVLQFGLVGQKGVAMKLFLYGIYHGRFIEMLLNHFDNKFSTISSLVFIRFSRHFIHLSLIIVLKQCKV